VVSAGDLALSIAILAVFIIAIVGLDSRALRKELDRRERDQADGRQRHEDPQKQIAVLLEANMEGRDADRREDRASRRISQFVSVITAVIVAIYTALTYMQWQVARDSFTAVQRPFVFVSEVRNTFYPADPTKLGFQFIWKNSGNTPTKNLRIYISGCQFASAMTKDFTFPEYAKDCIPARNLIIPTNLLGPQGVMWSQTINIPTDEIPAVAAHLTKMYFWGWASYWDTFGELFGDYHFTRACIELVDVTGNVSRPDETTHSITRPCDYGNCADDECRRAGLPPPPVDDVPVHDATLLP
jgi:hypothetical protein